MACRARLHRSADPPTRTLQVLLSTPVITYLVLAIQQASTQSATTHTSRAVVLKDLETTLKTLANLVKLIRDFCDRGRWGTGIDAPRGKKSARPVGVASDENAARVLVGNKIGEILEVSPSSCHTPRLIAGTEYKTSSVVVSSSRRCSPSF